MGYPLLRARTKSFISTLFYTSYIGEKIKMGEPAREIKIPGITKRSIVITAVIFLGLLIFQSLECSVNNWLNQAMMGDNGLSMLAINGSVSYTHLTLPTN